MAESDIPFPLLAGQHICMTDNEGNKVYYRIQRQAKMFDFPFPYEIPPLTSLRDNDISIGQGSGAISVFRTSANEMKQWVTWIDNDYLGVTWTILDAKVNAILGNDQPETKYTSPFGSVNFPKFIFDNPAGNVTFTISNKNPLKLIAGTLHIIMYDYKVLPSKAVPEYCTDIGYGGSR
jgi:hypothetical protein